MWIEIDSDEVQQPGGRYRMDAETNKSYRWVDDPPVAASALDRPLTVTFFTDEFAKVTERRTITMRDMVSMLQTTTAARKGDLPWLKLAPFGEKRTKSGSLRNNANVQAIDGVEGDYDAGAITPERAAQLLKAHGIAGIIYTSPSHSEDVQKWRVLCPTSRSLPPGERVALLARVNGALGGILAGESFTLSQSYYYGSVNNNPAHKVFVVEGRPIDDATEIQGMGKKGKPVEAKPASADAAAPMPGMTQGATTAELTADVLSSAVYHEALRDLAAKYAARGMREKDIADTLRELMEHAVGPTARDDRWKARYAEIPRLAASAVGKFAPALKVEAVAENPAAAGGDWRKLLQKSDKGPRGNLFNARVALGLAPEWHGRLALNEFTDKLVLRAAPPWHKSGPFTSRQIVDADYVTIAIWLQMMGIQVSSSVAAEAVLAVARFNRYDPVAGYLNQQDWDGTPRIDTWLCDYLGAEDTPYTRAVATKSLIAAVARVRLPGCQVDTVPVLEGAQGIGKSSALRALFGGEHFTDHMPDLTSKDAAIQLQGVWCVEFAELDKLSSAESARTKAFITTRFDRYRRPYGRVAEDVARRCVFWATLNPGGSGYLRDETGNRRYWPIACAVGWPEGRKVDARQLAAVRDQLWAEASWRYLLGEPHWLDSHALEAVQAKVAGQRFAEDAWAEPIRGFVAEQSEVSVADVLGGCLFKQVGQWTRHDQMRVGAVLTTLGWVRKQVRVEGGKREWRYLQRDQVVTLSPLSPLAAA